MEAGLSKPLISVVMPVLNGAATISFALASLRAQTCEAWECVIVDDGSTDRSQDVALAIYDSRIRYYRLDRNHGRGYARHYGLTIAQGRYITFLDADDWIYPSKFSEQVELLEGEPGLTIVSTGLAISDAGDRLVGVRQSDSGAPVIRPCFRQIAMPPLAFAPSMIAADLARATGFDSTFPISEDVDFLLRALYGNPYAVLPKPLYVYREPNSVTPEKVNSALDYCCVMFQKKFRQHPIESAIEIAKARAKQLVYSHAANFGFWNYIIQRRSRVPDANDQREYQDAWQAVSALAAAHAVMS